jgi:hypothetical protein
VALEVSRILHAGYLFNHGGVQIAFDPIFESPFSNNCHAFPAVQFETSEISKLQLSAVFISHYHDDHCSFDSLSLLDRNTPIYIFCIFDEMLGLLRQLGFKFVHLLELNRPVSISDFTVIPRRALDADVDSLFHITVKGLNILNVVDSWIDPETLDLLSRTKWDLILWPFQTMREVEVIAPSLADPAIPSMPQEWIVQLKILNPKFIVPSSCQFQMEEWSWYNQKFFPITYEQFYNEVSEILPGCRIQRIDPGASIELSSLGVSPGARISWIHPIQDQSEDYKYDPLAEIPATAEVAKRFPALKDAQIQLVKNYFSGEILERVCRLDTAGWDYFFSPRCWQVCLFDSMGSRTNYFYRVQGSKIEICDERAADWVTEAIATKVHSALTEGEALTSLYLRVIPNSKDVDPMEDPLIRSLYEGQFAAYQKAQLKKLKN